MALDKECKQALEETLEVLESTYGFSREHFYGKGLNLAGVEAGIIFPDGKNLLLMWGLDHSELDRECWGKLGICSWRHTQDGEMFIRCVNAPFTHEQVQELIRVLNLKKPNYIVFESFENSLDVPKVNKTFENYREARSYLLKLAEKSEKKELSGFGEKRQPRGKVKLRTDAKDVKQLLEELRQNSVVYLLTSKGEGYLIDLNTGVVIPVLIDGKNYLQEAVEKGEVEIPWYGKIEEYIRRGYKEFSLFLRGRRNGS